MADPLSYLGQKAETASQGFDLYLNKKSWMKGALNTNKLFTPINTYNVSQSVTALYCQRLLRGAFYFSIRSNGTREQGKCLTFKKTLWSCSLRKAKLMKWRQLTSYWAGKHETLKIYYSSTLIIILRPPTWIQDHIYYCLCGFMV